jgi:hypothetical protein
MMTLRLKFWAFGDGNADRKEEAAGIHRMAQERIRPRRYHFLVYRFFHLLILRTTSSIPKCTSPAHACPYLDHAAEKRDTFSR